MIIDKNIPIYIISISDDEQSQYLKNTYVIPSFSKYGYTNFIDIEAITPSNISELDYLNDLNFSEKRIYSSGRTRDWKITEKCIWYSHLKTWKKIEKNGNGIVVEHDCELVRDLDQFVFRKNVSSFAAASNHGHVMPAVGYYLNQSIAKKMIRNLQTDYVIDAPVDGYLHFLQKELPYGMNADLKYVYAYHMMPGTLETSKNRLNK